MSVEDFEPRGRPFAAAARVRGGLVSGNFIFGASETLNGLGPSL